MGIVDEIWKEQNQRQEFSTFLFSITSLGVLFIVRCLSKEASPQTTLLNGPGRREGAENVSRFQSSHGSSWGHHYLLRGLDVPGPRQGRQVSVKSQRLLCVPGGFNRKCYLQISECTAVSHLGRDVGPNRSPRAVYNNIKKPINTKTAKRSA